MAPSVSLKPLPDEKSFVSGYYGIGPASVRGIVRITALDKWSVNVKHLQITLSGHQSVACSPAIEQIKREKTLFEKIMITLLDNETLPPETILDIPFEIDFPEAPPDFNKPSVNAYPSATPYFLPAAAVLHGFSSPLTPYEARNNYQLRVELQEQFSTFYRPGPRVSTAKIDGFCVYDPRLIPRVLYPDVRHWRSPPGNSPCEYDLELEPTVLGPGDTLNFSYRIAISPESANQGVLLSKVKIVVREHHLVGDNRGSYVRGSVEILHWEQEESPPKSPKSNGFELAQLKPRPQIRAEKRSGRRADLSSTGVGPSRMSQASRFPPDARLTPVGNTLWLGLGYGGGGDGLYAEADVSLRIPNRGVYFPTTPRSNEEILPEYDIVTGKAPARIDVKHSIQITVQMDNASDIVLECGCVLTSIGKKECFLLLDESPEIVPALDYEKIIGGEVWHPAYSKEDPMKKEFEAKDEKLVDSREQPPDYVQYL